MEQRVYRGEVSPEELADYLLQHYSGQHGIMAQKIGEGDSYLVQIGHGKKPEEIHHAVTVAIAGAKEDGSGITVTMGQRQWITPEEATHAAFWGLLAVLVTPWVLFALLWPISEWISGTTLPSDIWTVIDTYAGSKGASASETRSLTHPHLGAS